MNIKRKPRGFAQDSDIIPKLEGMEVEFDEKVTLFPVELEEIREMAPKSLQQPKRRNSSMH